MSASLYTVIDDKVISPKIHFYRIEPTAQGLDASIREIFDSISQLCWLSKFDGSFLKDSFSVCANYSINYIKNNVLNKNTDKATEEAGEYVVSELSRQTIVNRKGYLDVPLGELFKQKASGNPGFDYFSRNLNDEILFAEAKYKSSSNAYGVATKQIVQFIDIRKDISDLKDLQPFVGENACYKATQGEKGFIVAFSATDMKTDMLIRHLQENDCYKKLCGYNELICVAVNI